jgi:hypothetical protein
LIIFPFFFRLLSDYNKKKKKNSAGREGERKKAEVDGGRRGRPRKLGVHTYIHHIMLYICVYMFGCNVYWWGTNATTCCITTCQPARPAGPQTRDVTAEERVRRNTHIHTHTHTRARSDLNTHTYTHTHTHLQTHTPLTYKRTHARAHTCIYMHTPDHWRAVL